MKREAKFSNEWVKDQYVKCKRSSFDISKEAGCTDANILRVLKFLGVKRRNRIWTNQQKLYFLRESKTKTFKEIAKHLGKTYEAIRIQASKMKIKSIYNPSAETKKPEIRKKISSSLQGIEPGKWEGFKETTNALIRKSVPYQEWRKSVFLRDGYRCVLCLKTGFLNADHIKPFAYFPELRFKIDNGRTLCKKCHLKTDTHGMGARKLYA